jgi:hypothetical protein
MRTLWFAQKHLPQELQSGLIASEEYSKLLSK